MPSFEASVDTARARDQILLIGREANTLLGRELNRIAKDAVVRMRADAPTGRTGATVKGINLVEGQGRQTTTGNFSVFSSGYNAAITASARDRNTGYDYLPVTRFGHRVAFITPVNRKLLKFEGAGRYRGQVFMTNQVRGQNPRRDWARNALLIAGQQARASAVKISRKLELVGLS